MEARFVLAPLALMLLAGLGLLVSSVVIVAIRKGGAAAGGLFALLAVGAVLLTAGLGYSAVGTHTVAYTPPPVVVYADPAPPLPPMPIPNGPMEMALPPGSGTTRILSPEEILNPEEVPPGGEYPATRQPIEATRPSDDAAVAATPLGGMPNWVTRGPAQEGDKTFVVVSGQQFADAATAWQDALNEATATVRRDFFDAVRPVGQWLLDPKEVQSIAVRDSYTEEIVRTAGENEFTVYRTHLKVELSPTVRNAIEPIWHQQVSLGRSLTTAGTLVLVTLFAAIFAGYFRLDDRTAGRYRWRLRLGTVAAMALAGVVTAAGVNAFPVRSVATPALPAPVPMGPPPPPVEQPMAQPDVQQMIDFASQVVPERVSRMSL